MSNSSYSHTAKVFTDLPVSLSGYQNPVHCEITEDEKNVTVDIKLQNNARPAGRLYEIEQNGTLSNILHINDREIISVFVGDNINTINFKNCTKLQYIEFADPHSIRELFVDGFNNVYCHNCRATDGPVIDIGSFINLSCMNSYAIRGNIRFKNDRIEIPKTVRIIDGNAIYHDLESTDSAGYPQTSMWKVSEFIFTPITQVSSNVGKSQTAPLFCFDAYYTENGFLSSITLNDVAINMISSRAIFSSNSGSRKNEPYRKIYVETLSGMHGITNKGIVNITDNNNRSMYSLSGEVFTFSHYELSDLEDQESHVFDGYLNLLPDERFVTSGLVKSIALSALSVWVPAALYDAWCEAWPNYTSCVYPYGYIPEPPTPVAPRETTFHFADAPDETYLFGSGFGRQILAYKGFILNGVWLKLPTSVELGSDIKDIGAETFLGCSSLSSVTIPSSVSAISWDAFKNCNEKLYDMTTIPGVKLVDGWAVEADYDNLPNNLNLTGCRGIAECLFMETNIVSVIIGDTTTRICAGAFTDCSCLTTVMIPNSIISIEDGVFDNCPNLSTIYVSAGDRERINGLLQASGFDTTNITFIEQ